MLQLKEWKYRIWVEPGASQARTSGFLALPFPSVFCGRWVREDTPLPRTPINQLKSRDPLPLAIPCIGLRLKDHGRKLGTIGWFFNRSSIGGPPAGVLTFTLL